MAQTGVVLGTLELVACIAGPIIVLAIIFTIVLYFVQKKHAKERQQPLDIEQVEQMLPGGPTLNGMLEEYSYSGSGSGLSQSSLAKFSIPITS